MSNATHPTSEQRQQTDTPAWGDLKRGERDCLRAIAYLERQCDVASGVRINECLGERYRASEVSHGYLYPNLDDLTERGLVEKTKRDGRTNEYRLTARGCGLLQQEARRFGEEAGVERRRLEGRG